MSCQHTETRNPVAAVEWCTGCGAYRLYGPDSWVLPFRERADAADDEAREALQRAQQPCACGHPQGWHYQNSGSCLECLCTVFAEPGSAAARLRERLASDHAARVDGSAPRVFLADDAGVFAVACPECLHTRCSTDCRCTRCRAR